MAEDFIVYGPLQDYMLEDSCKLYYVYKIAADFIVNGLLQDYMLDNIFIF